MGPQMPAQVPPLFNPKPYLVLHLTSPSEHLPIIISTESA